MTAVHDSQRVAEIARLCEARDHLAVADSQAGPGDDRIIMTHLRCALAILDAEIAAFRAVAAYLERETE